MIGGSGVNSIERLMLSNDTLWTVLLQDSALERTDIAASATSHNKISIFGGYEKSGLIFDTEKNSLGKILG